MAGKPPIDRPDLARTQREGKGAVRGSPGVEFDNSFDVPLRPAEAWPLLMDIQRIAPCMPGAEVTEVIDDTTYKGRIAVRLGPVALAFAGVIKLEALDGVNTRRA